MSVRIAVVGHVDNGKSTLIGRLMSDTGQVHSDKIEKVHSVCRVQGRKYEYAFLLDALEEEQAQGITMDVTEVPWAFEDRVYTFVDTPGHREFLKKMVGGASRVDAALLIVDALDGVASSLLRQLQLLEILGLQQVIVLVNKMDQVQWSEDVFSQIKLALHSAPCAATAVVLPISAWHGENLLSVSDKFPWYSGPTLVQALSALVPRRSLQKEKTRFQIQDVYRTGEKRIYVGRVDSGQIQVGDILCFTPFGETASVNSIEVYGDLVNIAGRGDAVGITLDRHLFLERGAMGYFSQEAPEHSTCLVGDIFWLDPVPLTTGEQVIVKMGTQAVRAHVERIVHDVDENTLLQDHSAPELRLMGRAQFRFDHPLYFDRWSENEATSQFVVCRKHLVLGGGRWIGPSNSQAVARSGEFQRGRVMWFTGLSGAGKSTLAQVLCQKLQEQGIPTFMLDGDVVRTGLCKDLGFSMEDRLENIRRSAEVAKLAADAGHIVLAAFISPLQIQRDLARSIVGRDRFIEVFVDCPLSVCEERDVKGLYAKARRGELAQFTGIGSDYEVPADPDLHIHSHGTEISHSLHLLQNKIMKPAESRLSQEAQ